MGASHYIWAAKLGGIPFDGLRPGEGFRFPHDSKVRYRRTRTGLTYVTIGETRVYKTGRWTAVVPLTIPEPGDFIRLGAESHAEVTAVVEVRDHRFLVTDQNGEDRWVVRNESDDNGQRKGWIEIRAYA